MGSTCIPIRVAAIFSSGGKVTPKWFELNRRKHEIKETTYFWQDRIGEVSRMHYAVSDGEALYELVYNTGSQTWTLDGLKSERP
jgi:hypothetical protein